MNPSRWLAALVPAVLLAGAPAALAQQQPNIPRIGYVYPAGGQQGTTVDLTIGGQFLDGVKIATVSGEGVKAAIVEHVKPITQQQFTQLRDRFKQLQEGPKDANAIKEIQATRLKMAVFVLRPMSPAIVETVRLKVTLAEGAEPGPRELRLTTPSGVTNPLVFCVGQLPEFSRRPSTAISDPNTLNLMAFRSINQSRAAPPTPEANITLPAVVNGQIMPGGVDRYRFRASKGLRLVVAAAARELIPYMADAVPGWFQAAITLYDAKGNELAFADHFRFHPDPAFHCEIPADGEYVLEVRDSIYRGREDFVYRITAGEVPFVTGIFPLGGKAGSGTTVELLGWNLPQATLTQDARDKPPGVYPLSVRKGEWVSNRVPFAVDSLPECLAQKTNRSQESAQAVTPPVIVNGRIEQRGQWQVFRFEGRAGEEIVAEVTARRLGSSMDSVLKLTDASGKELASCDDCEDKGAGLETHHADSYIRAKLPAGGTYFVHVGDLQRQAGPECAYRLRISPPRSDFELRVAPSSISVRAGASIPLAVTALRKDGFSGEIALSLKGAPAGFSLGGAAVPAGQDQVRITLMAPQNPLSEPVTLTLEGRAKIQGAEVVRTAVPAEDMMQAFAYRHLVPARELEVTVAGRVPPRAVARILGASPVKIPAGGSARVETSLSTNTAFGQIQVELNDPPEGISAGGVSTGPQGIEISLQSDGAKVKPGLRGNLIVSVYLLPRPPASGPASRPGAVQRRNFLGTLPAIPFEIVEADRRARGGAK